MAEEKVEKNVFIIHCVGQNTWESRLAKMVQALYFIVVYLIFLKDGEGHYGKRYF